MLATVGAKGGKLSPAHIPAVISSAPKPMEVTRPAPKAHKPFPSRAHLARITSQADYFATVHPIEDLDWEPEHDPVTLSLVTEAEARSIIDYYFQHCNPLVSGVG